MIPPLLFSSPTFNTVDLIIGIGLLWGIFQGFRRGLVREIIALAGIFISLYLAFRFSYRVENFLRANLESSESALRLIAFLVSFLLIFVGLRIVGRLLTKIINVLALGLLNRFLGALLGILKMTILMSALLLLLASTMEKELFTPEETESSIFYTPLVEMAQRIFPLLKENLEQQGITLPTNTKEK